MNSESEQSILDELEHLIFDEHKIISYKWAMNHFKIHVQKSKQILSKFVKKFQERLFIHHLITGFKSITIKHTNPYNSVYVSPKLRKKSKSRINSNSNNSNNSNNSYESDDDEDMSQSNDIDKYQSIYTQILCQDNKLEVEKAKFNKIVDIHIYCIARDEARNIKDFLNQQYEEDYHQQLQITTAYLSKQAAKYASNNKNSLSQHNNKNKNEVNELSQFSQISFDQCTTVPSPQLNRALARTKQEIQERERNKNKNKNVKKAIDFDETIENFKKNKNKNGKNKIKNTPPISDKLKGLNLGSKNSKNGKTDDSKSKSSKTSSLSPNANKNKKKKNDIRGVFAKQNKKQQENKQNDNKQCDQSQIEEEIEKQKLSKQKKKAGKINNFFNTEAEEKQKSKSKKKATKTKSKKKKSKSKKKKNEKIGSLKPARKRKRGAMEAENNLIPIDYASESSQDDEDMNNGYDGMSDDEELEAMNRSFKTHRNKRRKVMVDSDEDDSDKDEDDDIDIDDLDETENGTGSGSNSPKKLTKKQMKQMEKEKELKSRKNNFFGAAKNNPVRKKKKYKIEAQSYINDKGMFVTEDKKVTDDEDTDNDNDNNDNEQKEKERTHKYQHIEYDEDDDIDMKNKENSVDRINGKNNNKRKKSKNTVNNKKKKKVTPKKKKNGSITSFFKKK